MTTTAGGRARQPVDIRAEAPAPGEPAFVAELTPRIDEAIRAALSRYTLPSRLREAIEYSVLGGGKRLRPLLAMLSCRAAGADDRLADSSAVAVELIHAFSLVHDDLPAMDDDSLRRGRPTTHVQFGEAMGILAGDAMLSLAFQVLTDAVPDAALAGRLCAELALGTTGMIAGQVYDTLGGFPPGLTGRQHLDLIHHNKTGALITASCRMGALAGLWPKADHPHLAALTAYGNAIGLMFQIVDDLLDVEQTTEQLGKRAGKDEEAGKLTFPGLLGVAESRGEVDRLRTAAHAALAPMARDAAGLADLCEYLAVRTK